MSENRSWRDSTAFVVVAILAVGPLAIPLIWINRRMSLLTKSSLTILTIALTFLLIHLSAVLLKQLDALGKLI